MSFHGSIAHFFLALSKYSIVWMYHSLSIHLLKEILRYEFFTLDNLYMCFPLLDRKPLKNKGDQGFTALTPSRVHGT